MHQLLASFIFQFFRPVNSGIMNWSHKFPSQRLLEGFGSSRSGLHPRTHLHLRGLQLHPGCCYRFTYLPLSLSDGWSSNSLGLQVTTITGQDKVFAVAWMCHRSPERNSMTSFVVVGNLVQLCLLISGV